MSTGQNRVELIMDNIAALADRLLVTDRENDDELFPGDIEAAVASREVTIDQMGPDLSRNSGQGCSRNLAVHVPG